MMSESIFQKEDDTKVIKSYAISPEAIQVLDLLKKKHGLSRSRIVDAMVVNFEKTQFDSIYEHSLEVPIAAVVKHRPRFGQGRAYSDPKSKHFDKQLTFHLRSFWKKAPLEKPLKVAIEFGFKAPVKSKHGFPVKGDVDNYAKAALDIANKILWKDDSQIVHLTCSKVFAESDYILFKIAEVDVDPLRWLKKKSSYLWREGLKDGSSKNE